MEIRPIAEQVKSILEIYKGARDDDFLLYGILMREYGYKVNIPFCDLVELIQKNKLPNMISVWRARRKVMELYPELRGNSYKPRDAKQMEYVEFAKDKSI